MAPPMALSSPLNGSAPHEIIDICTLPAGSYCWKHNPKALDAFQHLIEDIKRVLGPSSGLDSSDVDVNDLIKVMRDYKSTESEWQEFAFADLSRNYTRNFVDHGNGKANMLILVWSPGKGSLVHDHAKAHCIMKVGSGVTANDARGVLAGRALLTQSVGVGSEREIERDTLRNAVSYRNPIERHQVNGVQS